MNPSKPLPKGNILLTLEFQPVPNTGDPYTGQTVNRVNYFAPHSELAGLDASKVGSALQRIVYQMLEKVIDEC